MATRKCNVFTTASTGLRVSGASTALANYLVNTVETARTTTSIMKILTDVRLVNKFKGNFYVNKGSSNSTLSDQLNGITQINTYARSAFGATGDLVVVNKINSSPNNSGYSVTNAAGQLQWQNQATYDVKIDPGVLKELRKEPKGLYNAPTESQQELEKAYQQMDMFKTYGEEVGDLIQSVAGRRYVEGLENYLNMMGRPEGQQLSEAVISETARLENSSEQRFSNTGQGNLGKIKLQAERLKEVFAKAGVKVTVEYNSSIQSKGKIGPGKNGSVVITLNPDKIAEDTAYHEYGHLYIELLGYNQPAVKAAVA